LAVADVFDWSALCRGGKVVESPFALGAFEVTIAIEQQAMRISMRANETTWFPSLLCMFFSRLCKRISKDSSQIVSVNEPRSKKDSARGTGDKQTPVSSVARFAGS
jgi:hypothetical protein